MSSRPSELPRAVWMKGTRIVFAPRGLGSTAGYGTTRPPVCPHKFRVSPSRTQTHACCAKGSSALRRTLFVQRSRSGLSHRLMHSIDSAAQQGCHDPARAQ